MTGPLPQPTDRLTRVRILTTTNGAYRVRYRLNGRRQSSAALPSRELAEALVAGLHEQFGGES